MNENNFWIVLKNFYFSEKNKTEYERFKVSNLKMVIFIPNYSFPFIKFVFFSDQF